ncbi:MAG: GAF domain-containing protein, partial [Candidatus Promineifilaceae bacterium]
MVSVFATKQPVVIKDTARDAEWILIPGFERVRSWLGAPLITRGQLIGLLALEKYEPNCYLDDSVEIAMAFANQAALAIDNARLYSDIQDYAQILRKRVASSTRDLRSLYEIARLTSQHRDLQAILDQGLNRILHDLDFTVGVIYVRDPESGQLDPVTTTSLYPAQF